MRKHFFFLIAALAGGLMVPAAASQVADSDKDGLPDEVEERLGTDPRRPEALEQIATFPATVKERPELDIVRVDFGNVGRDRWLWAVHTAKPYTFENAGLILYLDLDADPKTGRRDMGCEVTVGHSLGRPTANGFEPDGSPRAVPAPRVALVGGVLYLCHDATIRQEGGRTRLRFSILSETREPHRTVDGTGWVTALGPANSNRKPPVTLDELVANEGFERTEGLDLIWQLQADPANLVFSSVEAEREGMDYYDAEYRWPAVRGAGGSLTVTVPRAGRFHPAVVVYDAAGRETYELRIDGKVAGRFIAAEDDRRQRIYFLAKPVEFKGGEKLTLRTGGGGAHITEDLFLLAKKPPVRGRAFEIRHVQAEYVNRAGEGAIRLTWITTWPAQCTVTCGGQKLTEEKPVANHRVYIPAPATGATWRYRIEAPRPDGKQVSHAGTVALAPPKPFAGTAKHERIPLKVENPYPFPLDGFLVTSGVPFAKGELGDPDHVRLLDGAGREVPLQPVVAGRWGDGSIKWLRLSFSATVDAGKTATHTLEYGTQVSRAPARTPLACVWKGDTLQVETGPLRVEFERTRSGFPIAVWYDHNADGTFTSDESLTGDLPISARLHDTKAVSYTTLHAPRRIEIEESGPVRAVVKVTGSYQSGEGKPWFAYTTRFVFHAGSAMVRVHHTWGADDPGEEFVEFERIGLEFPLAAREEWSWRIGLGHGQEWEGRDALSLRQLRDDSYTLEPAAPAGVKTERADGWIDLSNGRWGVTAAVRDFWQLYPKGIGVDAEGLKIDLCPDFPEGTYDGCSKLDEIKLYFALMRGKYRVRRGVQKQHDLLLAFHPGQTDGDAARHVSQAFQEPLIAVCTPERYCDTLVFGEILPATAGRSPEYEKVCEGVYENYLRHRDATRGYGLLNFGDQFGERKVNWSNGEYDHHHAFLLQFIRTGDRRWYFLGDRAARHAIDVDTCHHGPRAGGVWIHAMGHTGGYFREQYEGSGIPGGGFTPSHTWTEGFCDWYFLSGDPTAAENAALVADYYGGAYLNNYDYSNCRDNGWHLLLTLATYRLTNDPYYLNAARIIVERTLERQTPGGGWHRQMVPGHCYCMPRHRGEANFMMGVLANGLAEYYRETSDQRVAQALLGGAKQVVAELWVEDANGFRYTSCPKMKGYIANNDMTAGMLFYAYRLGGDRQYADIAMRAMKAAFDGGIRSISHLRWTPRLIYHMDRVARGE